MKNCRNRENGWKYRKILKVSVVDAVGVPVSGRLTMALTVSLQDEMGIYF